MAGKAFVPLLLLPQVAHVQFGTYDLKSARQQRSILLWLKVSISIIMYVTHDCMLRKTCAFFMFCGYNMLLRSRIIWLLQALQQSSSRTSNARNVERCLDSGRGNVLAVVAGIRKSAV